MNLGPSGHAIFINGIQSSGKTTLAGTLEERASGTRVLHSDDLVKEAYQALQRQPLTPAGLIELVNRTFDLTLDTIDAWLQTGNVIVEGAWTEEQVLEAKNRFGNAGLHVVLRIDEEERRTRESERKDRHLGGWRPSWHQMPGPDALYDVVLDSSRLSPPECADAVMNNAVRIWGKKKSRCSNDYPAA